MTALKRYLQGCSLPVSTITPTQLRTEAGTVQSSYQLFREEVTERSKKKKTVARPQLTQYLQMDSIAAITVSSDTGIFPSSTDEKA